MLNTDQTSTHEPIRTITQRIGRPPFAAAIGMMVTQRAISEKASAGHVASLRSSMSLMWPVPVVLLAELVSGPFHIAHDLAKNVNITADGCRVNLRFLLGRALPAEYPANPTTH